jgi:hypothetical protein
MSWTDGIVLHSGRKNLKLKYSRTPLIWSLVIWISLALRVNLSRILQNYLALNYQLSDQVLYSVMVSRTEDQAWSKCSAAGTYCKYVLVTAEVQTAIVAHFQRNVQLSQFSAYLDGSLCQLIRVSAVLLFSSWCTYCNN